MHRIADGETLTVLTADLGSLDRLPHADLVYAGYSLPFLTPDVFERLWPMIVACLQPGGWLAVNLFGDRDDWVGTPEWNFHDETAARALFDGLELVRFDVEERDGPAYSGPKHWHVFDVIARKAGPDPRPWSAPGR